MKNFIIAIVCMLTISQAHGQRISPFGPSIKVQINAFPKVVDQYLFVQIPTQVLALKPYLEMYDSNGKMVYRSYELQGLNLIDMSDFNPGSYTVNLYWMGGFAQINVYKSFVR